MQSYPNYGNYMTPEATDIWGHLILLRWYNEFELAESRLRLVAKHFDDPVWIADAQEKWLNERRYWNGYYGGGGTTCGFNNRDGYYDYLM